MLRSLVNSVLASADVRVGKDILIHDNSFYTDVLTKGSLGFGESYMQGKWDSPHLDALIVKLLNKGLERNTIFGASVSLARRLKATLLNLQDRKHAPLLYQTHYNAGNHLFESFLDSNMIYTCAYWQNTDNLLQAQLDKIRLVGEKLKLKPGDRVLDIGCGWGGTARILSEMFDVQVTGVADTPNQIAYAQEHNSTKRTQFIRADYRDITPQVHGRFDKVYNVGFLEAVGPKNFKSFFEQVNGLLEDDGIFLTHTIVSFPPDTGSDPWIDRYIFPNGVLPQPRQLELATKGLFEQRDVERFGHYYARTTKEWQSRLDTNWHTIADQFDQPNVFKRMMDFYLLSSSATFQSGKTDLWQLVHTKPSRVQDYTPFRFSKNN